LKNLQPIFDTPLLSGITYLVRVGMSEMDGDYVYTLLNGIVDGNYQSNISIPFNSYMAGTYDAEVDGWYMSDDTFFYNFLYTPDSNISDPFTLLFDAFRLSSVGYRVETLHFQISAIPVYGVGLDDVTENQSFAAWLNNKIDAIFGTILGKLDSDRQKTEQSYEDATDPSVSAGFDAVEDQHQQEEEITTQAVQNAGAAFEAVELPSLEEQQGILDGITLLNSAVFDVFFGNAQLRFLLFFSLALALASFVLQIKS